MRSGGWDPGMELLPSLVSSHQKQHNSLPIHARTQQEGSRPQVGQQAPTRPQPRWHRFADFQPPELFKHPQAAVFYYAAQADSDTQASSFRNGSLLSPAASSLPSASTSSSSQTPPPGQAVFSLPQNAGVCGRLAGSYYVTLRTQVF